MPSLPDVIAAPPPRPARSAEGTAAPSPGAPGEREAPGTPFADLLDDAAGQGDTNADGEQADSSAQTGGAPAGADAALAALLPLLTAPPPATAPGIAADGALPESVPSTSGLPVVPPVTAPPADTAATPQPPVPAQPGPPQPAASLSMAPTTAATPDARPDGTPPQATTDAAAPAIPSAPLPASSAKPDPAPLFQTKDSVTPAKGDTTQAPSPQLQQAMAQAGGNAASNGGAGQNPSQGQGRGNPPGPEALSALSSTTDPVGAAPLPSALAPPAAHAAAHYAAHPGESAAARLPAAQVAGQLVRVVEAGGGEFHIDLKPEELGPVRVVAELSGARVALHVQAESPETLALLRRDIHHLERALSDAGFELDGGTLNFSLRGDGEPRGFAFSGQGDGTGGRQDSPGRAFRLADSSGALPPERAARPIDGLVDISV
ncbi:flagellar hook-length control protein FliK [Azospirillum brasilense]|uniref:Flagellar hook-length control protein n=1 Tax=Azospirillum brasilense TaxID=192 RepID=A0A235H8A5_AZOBR|nr:flagellar hook-length control protein FliK [Azospirillum brasilense]OYD82061.1 flagellar hook-length control protein [Azospirillum brasilense]